MSIVGTNKVFGYDGLKYGHVVASIDVRSHNEARALQEILQRAMAESAFTPKEAIYARWYNSISATREKAKKENWCGWEDMGHAD